jgi:hypothetical protein
VAVVAVVGLTMTAHLVLRLLVLVVLVVAVKVHLRL